MTLPEFQTKWLGKCADWDRAYGGQCVDLFRFYCHEVLGTGQPRPVTGASQFYTHYFMDPFLQHYFDRIGNTPEAVPLAGDAVIWSSAAGGGYGHVAVFLEGGARRFRSLDQNWPRRDAVTVTEHTYQNVLGWLHPKEAPCGS